ncbi:MAG TPA: galactokinase family protein [Gemmatimonadaceae bacterium]|nr:galactokinase family protein [Gemmatimonadaceae bacterium]
MAAPTERAGATATRERQLLERATIALNAIAEGGGRAPRERQGFHVPGRIEVLGKHTDYAGGRSLLCAVDRGIVVVVAARSDDTIRIRNADAPVADLTTSYDVTRAPARIEVSWWRYAMTVIERISRDFPAVRAGADIAFASDLPMDSGLSSSSALVVALFLALDTVNHLESDQRYRAAIGSREELAEYLGAVENGRSFGALEAGGGVGTLGGSEDHTAILCCRAGALSRYSFCPVREEAVIPLSGDDAFVIGFSGVAAAKAGNALAKYNEASLATQELLRLWNESGLQPARTLAEAIESGPEARNAFAEILPRVRSRGFTSERLLQRLEQFAVESREIIPQACDALRARDVRAFGSLVDRSQHNAERLLGNQVPETMMLAREARALGADAASAFGAGFGGSVWALTRAESAKAFMEEWRRRYAAAFPDAARHAVFFVTTAHAGARPYDMSAVAA